MLLIFDLDGTLFEAKPVVKKAGQDTAVPGYAESLAVAIRECGRLFPGVYEMLEKLYNDGYQLVICSKSPMEYIEQVLRHMGISGFFVSVYSSSGYTSKAKLVKEIVTPEIPCIVIGDTHGDISAAKENGLFSIAAMYGYGNKAMLCGADFFAESPGGIYRVIMSEPCRAYFCKK